MARKCEIQIVKNRNSAMLGDFYFSWIINVFKTGSKQAKMFSITPYKNISQYCRFESAYSARLSAKKLASEFNLEVISFIEMENLEWKE